MVAREQLLLRVFVPVVAILIGAAAMRFAPNQKTESTRGATSEVERGDYLVNQVAECYECHTPRKPNGDLETDAWLQGATIWITPVAPIHNWAERAPGLAGLPGMSEQDVETVLEKGTGPHGEGLHPPMHIYHMNPDDAKAIAAYLKSLPERRR
jgi:mono/diheme cytochrome c family protein